MRKGLYLMVFLMLLLLGAGYVELKRDYDEMVYNNKYVGCEYTCYAYVKVNHINESEFADCVDECMVREEKG